MRFEVFFALQGLGDSECRHETPRYLRTEALRFDTELESKDVARHVLSTCGGSGAVRLMKDLLSFGGTLHVVDR